MAFERIPPSFFGKLGLRNGISPCASSPHNCHCGFRKTGEALMISLSIRHLSKSYGSHLALNNFSAEFQEGIYGLLGPNGAGKTTLMHLITDNLKADGGTIHLQRDHSAPQNVLNMGSAYRELLGYMPQYSDMPPQFTAECYLWYVAALKDVGAGLKRKEKKNFIAAQIDQILNAVELSEVRNQKIKTFSGGMKQRLSLAQAVLGNPRLLILDEPTAGLDPKQRIVLRNYISSLAKDKIILWATHVVSDVEFIANKILLLKKGEIADFDSPEALQKKIEGRVWRLTVSQEESVFLAQRTKVLKMVNREEGQVEMRLLSPTPPRTNALLSEPCLEDYYLHLFGDEKQ